MIDFDKLFEEYFFKWYEIHKDSFEDFYEAEEKMPQIYEKWTNAPLKIINNISPKQYFLNVKEAKTLVDMLLESSLNDKNPSTLLLDRISGLNECADLIIEVLKGNYSIKQKMIAANLLNEMDTAKPFEEYISWLTNKNIDTELKDLAIEILAQSAQDVKEKLLEKLETADLELKADIADILSHISNDERIYNLLIELFEKRINWAVHAGYLGQYGDERAAQVLYKAAEECNYLEYIEIKNAIETLGGIIAVEREFSDDPYYKTIKDF